MSLQHFFLDTQIVSQMVDDSCDQESFSFVLDLAPEDIKHAKALRLQAGEHIGIIDAEGVYYECCVDDFSKNQIIVKIVGRQSDTSTNNNNVTLCFGILKGSKNDDVIRACSEIGVDKFLPVEFSRCVCKADAKNFSNKVKRWKNIAKSASMQSGQFRIPEICNKVDIEQLCEELGGYNHTILFWEESDIENRLENAIEKINNNENIAIIIGPEGGITGAEATAILNSNQNSYLSSLGSSILRAQSASMMACGLVKYLLDSKSLDNS